MIGIPVGAGDSQYSVAASGKIIDSQDVYTFRDVRVNILRAFRPDDGGVQSFSVSTPFFLVFLPFHKRNVGIPAVRAILQAADDCCRPQPPPSMLFSTCDCRVAATPTVYFSCRANPARRWFTIPRLLNHSSFRSAPNSSTWDFTGE